MWAFADKNIRYNAVPPEYEKVKKNVNDATAALWINVDTGSTIMALPTAGRLEAGGYQIHCWVAPTETLTRLGAWEAELKNTGKVHTWEGIPPEKRGDRRLLETQELTIERARIDVIDFVNQKLGLPIYKHRLSYEDATAMQV